MMEALVSALSRARRSAACAGVSRAAASSTLSCVPFALVAPHLRTGGRGAGGARAGRRRTCHANANRGHRTGSPPCPLPRGVAPRPRALCDLDARQRRVVGRRLQIRQRLHHLAAQVHLAHDLGWGRDGGRWSEKGARRRGRGGWAGSDSPGGDAQRSVLPSGKGCRSTPAAGGARERGARRRPNPAPHPAPGASRRA